MHDVAGVQMLSVVEFKDRGKHTKHPLGAMLFFTFYATI